MEVRRARGGRGEMEIGHDTGHSAVHLLRPRIPLVEGPQTRLDMGDATTMVEGAEAPGRLCRRVALNQHPIRLLSPKHVTKAGENSHRHIARRLVVAHHPEV